MEEQASLPRDVAFFLNQAFASGEIERICLAIGTAMKDYNTADLARKSGLRRESIYRAFSGSGTYPNFKTVLGVLDAMGFRLKVTAHPRGRAKPNRSRSG